MRSLQWTPDLAKRFWRDLAGTEFLAEIAFSRFAASYLVDLSLGYVAANAVVLDFGSGFNAHLARELLGRGFTVRVSEPTVEEAQLAPDIRTHSRFRGIDPDIVHDSYDGIFAVEVIEHLFDDAVPAVMTRIRSGLKSGGVLVMTTPNGEDLRLASRYCPVCQHLFHPWGHLRSFDRPRLLDLLTQSGFACEALLNVDFSSTREPIEELKELKRKVVAQADEAAVLLRDVRLPERARRLIENMAAWKEIEGGGELRGDPSNRQIGAGGTLVAFARRV